MGRPPSRVAAEDDLGALLHRVLEVRIHLLSGGLVVHGANEGVVVEGIAELPALCLLDDGGEEVVVDALVDEHALGRAADLAGAEEAAEDGALRGGLEVGVGADDDRPVAARLDEGSLEAGRADDLLGGRVRADEADAVDVLVLDSASPTSPPP